MITTVRILQGIIWLIALAIALVALLPLLIVDGIGKVFKSIFKS